MKLAYGTLLREPRRALHARIVERLENQFTEIAENQPELLAHHCAEASLIEKAAGLWGKAGQRSLERSALVEAVEQFKRAVAQIASLPATPALRREQIKLQVALVNPLMHVKGFGASETKAAAEQARLLIEQAEALGEPPRRSSAVVHLAEEKGSLFWKALGTVLQGCVFVLTGKASAAVQMITPGVAAVRSTGQTLWMPSFLSFLARAYADLGQFDEAWRCIGEAMTAAETTRERWYEADIHRTAGEIALKSPGPDAAKAEGYFDRALAVARKQQAKSWELRAAMSMARLWRDQDKRDEARALLAPVYGWFTEGFDTLDLKEAKALLDELAS